MEPQELHIEEVVEYIFERLIKEGIVVKREDINLILDLELEYLVEHGFAYFGE